MERPLDRIARLSSSVLPEPPLEWNTNNLNKKLGGGVKFVGTTLDHWGWEHLMAGVRVK